jgi:hypothetical protein
MQRTLYDIQKGGVHLRILVLALIMLSLITGCSSTNGKKEDFNTQIGEETEEVKPETQEIIGKKLETYDLEEVNIAGLRIGSSKDEVIELYNEPDKITHFEYHEGLKEVSGEKIPYEEWIYNGLKLYIMNNTVIFIEIFSEVYDTSFGLSVGDPVPTGNPNTFIEFTSKEELITSIMVFELYD